MKTSGENIAALVLELPPQPWSSAQVLQILARAELAGFERAQAELEERAPVLEDREEDDDPTGCKCPTGPSWVYTGTAYGGDDPSYHGEGRVYCSGCGADGDA